MQHVGYLGVGVAVLCFFRVFLNSSLRNVRYFTFLAFVVVFPEKVGALM